MTNKTIPAFPMPKLVQQAISVQSEEGMTLRDYFAAKAMLVVLPDVIKELQRGYSQEKTDKLKAASCDACYGIADEMLKARER